MASPSYDVVVIGSGPAGLTAATEAARKLLSAAYRTGQRFGLTHLVEVLTGKANARATALGHDRLAVFGLADEEEQPLLKPIARALLAREALVADEHGGLALGPAARPILRGEVDVPLVLPPRRASSRRRSRGGSSVPDLPHDPLFEALRARRREIASEAGVPPYVIFHDATLREMATRRPMSRDAMAEISGVGERKLDAYGDAFLEVIRAGG